MRTLSIWLLAMAMSVLLRSFLCAQVVQRESPGSSVVEAVGCVDRKDGRFVLTNERWYVVYYLTGRTTGLENHIGDAVTMRGIELASPPSSGENNPPKTLQVTSVEVMVHAKPEGVRPELGSLDDWVTYRNLEYGLGFRYPATFPNAQWEYAAVQSNFAGQAQPLSNPIKYVGIPRTIYPDSNFVGGSIALFVSPDIRSAGTCKQFGSFWPQHTDSTAVNGVSYSRTLFSGVACGTGRDINYFHAFQNGLCYEFAFEFALENGGGMDVPCSMQWVSEDNQFELMRSVLSTVSFLSPQLKVPTAEVPSHKPASLILFEHGPVVEKPVGRGSLNTVDISWKADAEYVQVRYPCSDFLYASTVQPRSYGLGKCGDEPDTNLPPNGSMSLLLSNYNSNPVELLLTIEPFVAGVGYPKEARTISIRAPMSPHAPLPEDKNKSASHK